MTRLFKTFRAEEDGNTTVDWIVLTAGIMMLSTAVLATVASGAGGVVQDTSDQIEAVQTNRAI